MAAQSRKTNLPEALIVKRGHVSIKILPSRNLVRGVEYPQFMFSYREAGKRLRRRFADREEAIREAELVATKLANGENEALKLTPTDRAIYVQCHQILAPYDRPLNLAIGEYVDALKLLPPGISLREAVEDFVRRNNTVRESKLVAEAVAEYIRRKEQAGKSERHLGDMRSRLKRFKAAFSIPMAQLTGPLIQAYLDGLPVSNRSKLNDLRHVIALMRFAVRQKYAPRDLLDEIEAIERPESKPAETEIFTPEELEEMLNALRPELRPWLALAAFCGLRSAEILRLEWPQVNLERRFVEVKAQNAKTAQRRLVPLCDAAIQWLTPHAKPEGRVAIYSEENKFHGAILKDVNAARKAAAAKAPCGTVAVAKFQWKRNGLRHSFCSYRLAASQDAAKTALEAGNSPAMIFRHYHQLVTPDEANRWFGITPVHPANILAADTSVAA